MNDSLFFSARACSINLSLADLTNTRPSGIVKFSEHQMDSNQISPHFNVLPYLILSDHISSYLIVSYLIRFYLILSYLITGGPSHRTDEKHRVTYETGWDNLRPRLVCMVYPLPMNPTPPTSNTQIILPVVHPAWLLVRLYP